MLQNELASKDDKIQNIRIKLHEIRREKKNAQQLTRYHTQKKSNVKYSQLNGDEGDSSHELNTKLKEYNDIIVEKDDLLNQLSEKVDELENEHSSQPAVVTFVKGQYSDDVRVLCLDLLSRNVGIQNVEPIIRSVSKNIFKAELGRLPCTSKLAEMLLEARTVSHLQLAEQIPGEQFNTLHTDGTTKFGHKYGSYQVSTETSCYTLGLADMQSGTAVQTLEVLKQVVNDIGKAAEQHGKSHTPSPL